MGTGLIFIGFLFLINPELITLDVFPDFIGYFLIAKGLSRVALLEERVASARKFALLLAGTSFVKLLSCAITFSTRIESTRLTVCFAFLVAELWLSWLFCDNAFKGLQYLAIRKDGDLVLRSFDLVRSFTTVFFMVKAVVNFLPQVPVIFFTNIDAEGDQVENYSEMVKSFRSIRSILFIIGALALIILGIYTARLLRAYLRRCREDAPFATGIRSAYEENVEKNRSLQTRLAIKGAFFWYFCAFLCLADLYLDFINVVPKPLFALFVFFGLRRLASFVALKKWHFVLALVSFFVQLSAYAYRLVRLFLLEGDFPYVFPTEALAAVFGVVGAVFSLIPVYITLDAIGSTAATYTSYSYKKRGILLGVFSVILVALSFSQYLFVGRSDFVVFAQWALLAVTLYLHQGATDEIYAEAEYKLM